MSRTVKIIGVIVLIGLLILVRAFENKLFYDPLLQYFKGDYNSLPLPEMDIFALQLGVVFRFVLNTSFSLGILWLIFSDVEILKVSVMLYGLLFILLFIAFSIIVYTSGEGSNYMMLFYVRRFLIQPLFLLILLPAFYFQKQK